MQTSVAAVLLRGKWYDISIKHVTCTNNFCYSCKCTGEACRSTWKE